jgi:UPF0716 protein FxsA
MFDVRVLMKFLDISFILKLLYIVLLCSLIPLVDMLVVLQLAELIPKYILMAFVTASGLAGILISYFSIREVLRQIHYKIRSGYYPRNEVFELVGLLPSAFLLITPGLIGDLIGLLLLIPSLRRMIGQMISGRTEDRFKELYEYLKLYEL